MKHTFRFSASSVYHILVCHAHIIQTKNKNKINKIIIIANREIKHQTRQYQFWVWYDFVHNCSGEWRMHLSSYNIRIHVCESIIPSNLYKYIRISRWNHRCAILQSALCNMHNIQCKYINCVVYISIGFKVVYNFLIHIHSI